MIKPKLSAKLFQHAIKPEIAKKYPRFAEIAKKIDQDDEITQFLICSNVMALSRLHMNEHGIGHIRIALKYAIDMFEILLQHNVTPSIVKDYGLTNEDALIVILMATVLHDIGHVITRKNHGTYSLSLCKDIILRLLKPHYSVTDQTVLLSETLHAMYSHMSESTVTTIEGGIVRVADALDIQKGRSKEAIRHGKIDIHSISTAAIGSVSLKSGTTHPIHVRIEMSSTAGIFQLDSLLKKKLQGSGLEKYISVYARIRRTDAPEVSEYRIR